MLRNIINIYLFSGVLVTCLFATFFYTRSKAAHIKHFALFSLSTSVYLLGYLLEINVSSLEQMIFWNQIQYLTLPFIPAFLIVFVIRYMKKNIVFTPKLWATVFFVPVLTFLLRITNSLHGLFYTQMTVSTDTGVPLLYNEKGFGYYLHLFYLGGILLLVAYIILSSQKNKSPREKKYYRYLAFAALMPYAGVVLNISGFSGTGIDHAALIIPVSCSILAYSVNKHDFLEITAMARESAFEYSSDGMIILDQNFRVTDSNQKAKEIFPEIKDMSYPFPIDNIAGEISHIFKSGENKEFVTGDYKNEKNYDIESVKLYAPDKKITGYLKIIRDITKSNQMKKTMEKLANTDSLSRLNNRNSFMRLAGNLFDINIKEKRNTIFIMMDIDNFKSINDKLGHAAGDMVIENFGKLLKKSFRRIDITGRVGGEEFAVILTDIPLKEAYGRAENFRKSVEGLNLEFENEIISLTVSLGITDCHCGKCSLEDVIKRADRAMYLAKSKGKNRIEVNCSEDI